MIGAGVFAALAPAAEAAGAGLLIGLGIAAVVAYCNATSSAQLAAIHPESGGTYVYGTRQLGPLWGYLAGWSFVVGKLASCAAMALTFGYYAEPSIARSLAVGAVLALTAVNLRGVQKTALLTRAIVAIVLASLGFVVIAALTGGTAEASWLSPLEGGVGIYGTLQAAGFLFFAFAGYARIATLGEEVRDPARTIPRAIPIALGMTLVVYAGVAIAVLIAIGPAVVAMSPDPLAEAVRAGDYSDAVWVVRLGATVATLGVLLSLIAGVSRTMFAMASDGHFPRALASVHPTTRVPHYAEVVVAAVVIVVVLTADVRDAIGFSSFGVLVYYGIANASALTLRAEERRWPRGIAMAGVAGCGLLCVTLPFASVIGGLVVIGLGAAVYAIRGRVRGGSTQ